jgi:hypothetical protein
VRTAPDGTTSRRDVRIVLHPQGRASMPGVAIDTHGAAAAPGAYRLAILSSRVATHEFLPAQTVSIVRR